jgi:hypothetical protein
MAATVLLFAISAIAAHATVAGGSPNAALGADSFSARVGRAHAAATQESSHMHRLMAVAASGAVAMGSSAFAQDAVQWRVEDGGNGHWYAGVKLTSGSNIGWTTARARAAAVGAELVALNSDAESAWVFEVIASNPKLWSMTMGPWVGAFQDQGASEPSAGWRWIDGDVVDASFWSACCLQPDNAEYCGGDEEYAAYWFGDGVPSPANRFCDLVESGYCENRKPYDWVTSAVFEWSADCNSDGVVDYGQIRAGELDDANANNIPDCCEAGTACGCAADISGNGIVDAVDLAAVLSSWGNAPTGKTNADINRDGEVNAIDLAEVLSSWGTCP